ncbi:NAD(P)-dependent oxidoreductase [Streptomyces sp. NPDC090127]|uniref:NAD(P)-dependent oxidoreductase n=1 Tax=Streptomyces sp. NPDC090127 TaxID=3365953 RepID=UPI003816CCB8
MASGYQFSTRRHRSMSNNNAPVSVVGLGLMGQALAATVLKNGHPTTVWNRSADKADALVAEGAKLAGSVAEAVAASDVVIVCVSTYEVTRDLIDPLAAELAGKTLINLTTGTPDDARSTAAWAAEHGISYLDGAIMAIPPLVGTPMGQFFYGGKKAVFEAHEPLLLELGGASVHVSEDTGVPLIFDLALLTVLYAAGQGWGHAHALVNTAGISAQEFQPYVNTWVQYVVSAAIASQDQARVIDEADYATEISNVNTNQLALGHILQASKELGVDASWLEPVKAAADELVAEGYGNDSFARTFEKVKAKNKK